MWPFTRAKSAPECKGHAPCMIIMRPTARSFSYTMAGDWNCPRYKQLYDSMWENLEDREQTYEDIPSIHPNYRGQPVGDR